MMDTLPWVGIKLIAKKPIKMSEAGPPIDRDALDIIKKVLDKILGGNSDMCVPYFCRYHFQCECGFAESFDLTDKQIADSPKAYLKVECSHCGRGTIYGRDELMERGEF